MVARDTTTVSYGGHADSLPLYGEVVCLDFANTVDPRHSDHAREFLTGYDDLVTWARHAGVLDENRAAELRAAAERDRPAAERAFRRAVALRQALYAVFAAVAAGRPVPDEALREFNAFLSETMAQARVAPCGSRFEWRWAERPGDLDAVLPALARSAADLLTSDRLDRVRECPGEDGCGWLFLDTSKNGSRRWCSMQGCGSRAKARRYAGRRRRSG